MNEFDSLIPHGTLTQSCVACGQVFPMSAKYFVKGYKSGERYERFARHCVKCSRAQKRLHYLRKQHYYAGKTKERSRRIRLQIIDHYSKGTRACACCGVDRYEFLAIDHVYGGGLRQRKKLSGGSKNAGNLYTWIIRNGFPEGFAILCHNCNQAKGFHGECPHETERRLIFGEDSRFDRKNYLESVC